MSAFENLVKGQDVAFVATSALEAAEALTWIEIGPTDVFYELGCGNATVTIEAARRGATAVCVESDPTLAAAAERAVHRAGMGARVTVRQENFFDTDVSSATIVYLYLLPSLNARLAPSLSRQLARSTARVLSRSFEFLGWPCGRRARFGAADDAGTLFMQWRAPLTKTRLADRLYLNPLLLEEECAEHALMCLAAEPSGEVRRTIIAEYDAAAAGQFSTFPAPI